jgi:hypothetical protein
MRRHIIVSGERFELRLLRVYCHEAGLDLFSKVRIGTQKSESEVAADFLSADSDF